MVVAFTFFYLGGKLRAHVVAALHAVVVVILAS